MRQIYRWLLPVLLLANSRAGQAQIWQAAVAVPNTTLRAVTVGANGDVYVTGFFADQATFGSTTLSSAGASDLFVAKWSKGAWAWAVGGGGSDGNDGGQGIAVSGSSVYVGGRFTGTATFGGTTLMGTATNVGNPVVLKYTDQGSSASLGWVVGGSGANLIGLAVSGSAVYVAGNFTGTATLGSTQLTSAGQNDVFVARYTDQGSSASLAWATRDGTTADDYPEALAVSGSSVYLTGNYSAATTLSGTSLPFTGRADYFVARYTDQGTQLANGWAVGSAGSFLLATSGLAVSGSSVYLAGSLRGTATVAGTTLTSSSPDNSNAFVARYTDQGSSAANGWASSVGGNCDGTGLAVSGSNVFITGYYVTQATFGSITLGQTQSGQGSNVFVARYADQGSSASAEWAAGGGNDGGFNLGYGLAVAGSDVYVVGQAGQQATFGSYTTATDGGLLARLGAGSPTPTLAPAGLPALAAWPVPAHGRLTLRRPPGTVTGAELLDALGRVVRRPALPTTDTVLDVGDLPPGLYLLRLRLNGQPLQQRLVLE